MGEGSGERGSLSIPIMSKAKKGLSAKSKITKKQLSSMLATYFTSQPNEYFPLRQIFRDLKLTNHPLKMLCVDILNDMIEQEKIIHNQDGELALNNTTAGIVEGIFTRTNGGRNFVDSNDGVGISVYDEDTMHALPGDKVRVSILAKRRGSKKVHGEVIEILQRNEKPVVGILQIAHKTGFLVSPSGNLPHDVLIPEENLHGGHDGDKALVHIIDWPEAARNPIGEVIEVLGKSGDNNTEMHAILAEYGLPYSYPKEVEDAANNIDPGITPEEIAKREDFRNIFTCTIDPRDAKDFDDALSVRKIKDGVWEIGVHIADVSHYVTEKSVIDEEAVKRATSIYLVDRTIPMLPERLCNGICSLRPNEEKLTFSVIFEMNEDAEVLNYRIRHTVINSNRRYTYEEVQHLLEERGEATECQLIAEGKAKPTEPTPAAEITEALKLNPDAVVQCPADKYADELIILNRMAHLLRDRRMDGGAVDFNREEVRFEIDESGKPLSVYFKEAKDANKLVEEFMLLANRTVAESVGTVKDKGGHSKTLPYRIHDLPDPGKLENLSHFVAKFGLSLHYDGSKTEVAKSLNKLLRDVKGEKMQSLVENVSLRAMMKARYSIYNIGHYGLAFDYYTHFTSPIRRYPDLMVHRLLTKYAEGAPSASAKKYEELCEHSSAMEQLAATAERSSIKYKQVEFMADKIGEEFDAKISGVTEFGIYAEIEENKCEGLIAVRYLGDEAFDFDDRNFCLVGRKTHHTFALGDSIRIKVARANLYRKQLDFDFVKKLSADGAGVRPPFYAKFLDEAKASQSKSSGKASRGAKNGKKGRRR